MLDKSCKHPKNCSFFSDVLDQYITFCWPLDWLVPALGLPVRVIALDFRASWWRWGCSSPEESVGWGTSQCERWGVSECQEWIKVYGNEEEGWWLVVRFWIFHYLLGLVWFSIWRNFGKVNCGNLEATRPLCPEVHCCHKPSVTKVSTVTTCSCSVDPQIDLLSFLCSTPAHSLKYRILDFAYF